MQSLAAADRMGFDPRRWRPPPGGPPLTANVDALLAENEALRQEVWRLRQDLQILRQGWQQPAAAGHAADASVWGRDGRRSRSHPGWAGAGTTDSGRAAGRASTSSDASEGGPQPRSRVTQGTAPSLTVAQVQRWIEALERQPGWGELRVGPPAGLRQLVEELRARSWNPALSLEEDLDRRQIGLGRELAAALRGPHSRGRWAVRAAFALYGPSAAEWLSDAPQRVVQELRQRLRNQAAAGRDPGPRDPGAGPSGRRRGTRTANHSQDGRGPESARAAGADSDPGAGPQGRDPRSGHGARSGRAPSSDPRREALRLLGLEEGASRQQIKRAYRQLAKAHHPDLGGDVQAFHRLDAAYRLLIGS